VATGRNRRKREYQKKMRLVRTRRTLWYKRGVSFT
jgi:hypothetical protein